MDSVRLGIIGLGIMGPYHARYLLDGEVPRARLTAVCDTSEDRLSLCDGIHTFTNSADLIRSGAVDAVLIETPHYTHTPIGIDALEQGLHVLVDKPISAHKADAERLISAHTNPRQVFAVMYQLRIDPGYHYMHRLVHEGELGEIQRVNWVMTNMFRSDAYYASGGWRATWKGEGGGVLLNQAPHYLDLLQWICGMPARVRAFCHCGKHHPIEVEDDVTAYFEYPNGATGVFIASTGEVPGADRLEIVGDLGSLIYENGRLRFSRTEGSVMEFRRTTTLVRGLPNVQNEDVPLRPATLGYREAVENFVTAILDGSSVLCPGVEGLNSLELANAMLYSSLTNETVELPLDGSAYAKQLDQLIHSSAYEHVRAKSGGL